MKVYHLILSFWFVLTITHDCTKKQICVLKQIVIKFRIENMLGEKKVINLFDLQIYNSSFLLKNMNEIPGIRLCMPSTLCYK